MPEADICTDQLDIWIRRAAMADRLDQCNRCLSSVEILKRPAFGSALRHPRKTMSATSQQNVMQIYESAVLRRGSFPCRPATVDVIVAAP